MNKVLVPNKLEIANWDPTTLVPKGITFAARRGTKYWERYLRVTGRNLPAGAKVLGKTSLYVTVGGTLIDLACRPFD